MIYFEKSQPTPVCLAIEKAKPSSENYKCGTVLQRLNTDFEQKCYICESKNISNINVEHFRPHKGDRNLMFDWNNLFLACQHCNNIKLGNYEDLIDCTNEAANIEGRILLYLEVFPMEVVGVSVFELEMAKETETTVALLHAVYNGTTPLKQIESSNLRNAILENLLDFETCLERFYDNRGSEKHKKWILEKIKIHLSKSSAFTAFKRQIVRDDANYLADFESFFD